MSKEQIGWSHDPTSLIIVGEITNALRAQGNVSSTGTKINTSNESPVIDGVYHEIPQAQVGLMTYQEFEKTSSRFNQLSTEDSYSGKHPWNLLGAISLDGLFYPYTTVTDEYRAGKFLPYWTKPSSEAGNDPTSNELNPFNPFNVLQGISSTGGYTPDNDPWMSSGHNINMALVYNPKDSGIDGSGGFVGDTGIYPRGSGSPVDFYFEKDHWARHTVETSAVRGVGLKGPIILTGWGYDEEGNPVPSSGNTFHPEAMYNPHLWKSGPVDLRWNNNRGVWTGGGSTTKMYLVKVTNTYNPPNFSYEVDRNYNRSQYGRNSPDNRRAYTSNDPIYDPEYVAYTGNVSNTGTYEQLDFAGIDFPFYEAFVIRETIDNPHSASSYYNAWTEDCQDCGHVSNPCDSGTFTSHGSSSNLTDKKILIENPLRQSLDVGDLAFTVDTGRKKLVNTATFSGGTGSLASGVFSTDASGVGAINITNSGTGYTYGAFALLNDCSVCVDLELTVSGEQVTGGIVTPSSGLPKNLSCDLSIYPQDATVETESLPIHWIMQAEFKNQQVVTYVECDGGLMQTCSVKLQTQGFKTCEYCGEDTTLINSF